MIIATAGHVDHGKTLLVRALTGIDTDRLDEEKRRGLTIDLGFAYQPLGGDDTLGFVDVPGHIRFINNMLAGVSGIDCALLVIAADDGPMPQTVEHLAILHLLGVERGAVAITKIDRVSTERVEEVRRDTINLLADTVLAGAPIFALSGITGEGVEDLREHLTALSGSLSAERDTGYFRLAIDRCFTIRGSGLVVTGSVFSGSVSVGDELIVSPGGHEVRVRGIHAQNQDSEAGHTGERCAINITGSGLGRDDIHRGDWLMHPALHAPTSRFDAGIQLLSAEPRPLKHWTPVHIHTAANHVTGRVALLDQDQIAPGERGLVQLVVAQPIDLLRNDRVILRNQAATRTIGGGEIIDPYSPKRGRARPIRLQHLHAMAIPDPALALEGLLALYPGGTNLTSFFRAANLTGAVREELTSRLEIMTVVMDDEGQAQALGFQASHWKQLKADLLASLRLWHQTHPDSPGPGERQLRSNLRPVPPAEVFARLTAQLIDEGSLRKSGATLHLPDHSASLTSIERDLWKRIQPILNNAALKPPVVHELASQLNIAVRSLDKFLGRAVQLGLLSRVVKNRYFLPETVVELARLVEELAVEQEENQFSASQYRDVTGIGRNLAIEVLEYFDRVGLTRRIGDKRVLVKRASDVQ